jgi:hypothetical protein
MWRRRRASGPGTLAAVEAGAKELVIEPLDLLFLRQRTAIALTGRSNAARR